jgi:hypothetical protein
MSEERSEVAVPIVKDPPGEMGARPRLARRELDVGICLVVAEQDVVPGPVALTTNSSRRARDNMPTKRGSSWCEKYDCTRRRRCLALPTYSTFPRESWNW